MMKKRKGKGVKRYFHLFRPNMKCQGKLAAEIGVGELYFMHTTSPAYPSVLRMIIMNEWMEFFQKQTNLPIFSPCWAVQSLDTTSAFVCINILSATSPMEYLRWNDLIFQPSLNRWKWTISLCLLIYSTWENRWIAMVVLMDQICRFQFLKHVKWHTISSCMKEVLKIWALIQKEKL